VLWARRTGGTVDSSPFVTHGVVYVGSGDGKVYALNAADGAVKWTFETNGNVNSSPAVAYGAVYIGSDNNEFVALNAVHGS
jgi:outer membrane protein assembly factor BamB